MARLDDDIAKIVESIQSDEGRRKVFSAVNNLTEEEVSTLKQDKRIRQRFLADLQDLGFREPTGTRERFFRERGTPASQARTGGAVEDFRTLINRLSNIARPVTGAGFQAPLAGAAGIGEELISRLGESPDLSAIGIGPANIRTASDIGKALQNILFGQTQEQAATPAFEDIFGPEVAKELRTPRGRRELSGLEAQSPSGNKFRIMEDGTIQLING